MPRFTLLALSLIVCCFLAACQQGEAQGIQKIGVVNINRLMVDSNAGRAAAKYIENLQDTLRNQLTGLQSTGDTEKESKAPDEKIQKEVQMAYATLQTEQQNVQNVLNDVLHRTVENFRKANGYTMILFSDVVLSFEESVDVTSQITAAMNKEPIEFKPVTEPKQSSEKKEEPKAEMKSTAPASK
ncbi:MAG: OmpH family outer membrane protein [Desulfovibrio sp.]|nr:OmpH family outer membrane protein [Desulfovibrio sp.]